MKEYCYQEIFKNFETDRNKCVDCLYTIGYYNRAFYAEGKQLTLSDTSPLFFRCVYDTYFDPDTKEPVHSLEEFAEYWKQSQEARNIEDKISIYKDILREAEIEKVFLDYIDYPFDTPASEESPIIISSIKEALIRKLDYHIDKIGYVHINTDKRKGGITLKPTPIKIPSRYHSEESRLSRQFLLQNENISPEDYKKRLKELTCQIPYLKNEINTLKVIELSKAREKITIKLEYRKKPGIRPLK